MNRLIAVVFISFPLNLLAHSGGTDEYGCHTNSATDEYHCHNDIPTTPTPTTTTPTTATPTTTTPTTTTPATTLSDYDAGVQDGIAQCRANPDACGLYAAGELDDPAIPQLRLFSGQTWRFLMGNQDFAITFQSGLTHWPVEEKSLFGDTDARSKMWMRYEDGLYSLSDDNIRLEFNYVSQDCPDVSGVAINKRTGETLRMTGQQLADVDRSACLSSCVNADTASLPNVDERLSMAIPSFVYNHPLHGPMMMWAEFEYVPTFDADMWWRLGNFGVVGE